MMGNSPFGHALGEFNPPWLVCVKGKFEIIVDNGSMHLTLHLIDKNNSHTINLYSLVDHQDHVE